MSFGDDTLDPNNYRSFLQDIIDVIKVTTQREATLEKALELAIADLHLAANTFMGMRPRDNNGAIFVGKAKRAERVLKEE